MKDTIYRYSVGSIADTDQWVDGVIEATQEPYVEMPSRMFYVGTHRGKAWTESDLDTMVRNFSAPKGDRDWEAPVQLDHSESARDTVGNIRRVGREGPDWKGILRFVGTEADRAAPPSRDSDLWLLLGEQP